MNTIEELIQKECPEGVEFKTLGEVLLSLNTGLNPRKFFRLNTPDADFYYVTIREIKGGYIHVDEKTDRINKNALKLCNNRSNLEIGDVLFSGTGTIGETVVIENEPSNWNIKEGVYSLKPRKEIIVSKYLVYILRSSNIALKIKDKIAGGTVKSIPMKELAKIEIPVPPLSVQHKIVEILDKFTSLEAELQAELEARKKQYEYYRNQLLDFTGREDVERIVFNEICDVINGRAYKQSELLSRGKYRVLRVGNFFSNDSWYYSDLELEDKYYCQNGDLLYAWSASFGPHIWEEEKVIYHYHIWKLVCKEVVDKRFLFYWLQSNDMERQVSSEKHGATMAHLTKEMIEKLIVPLPSLEEQHRIVTILDKFEALINGQTVSLAAEIKARHQQYEYYRDKLLTFNRKD